MSASATALSSRLSRLLRHHGVEESVCDCLELGDWRRRTETSWLVADGESVLTVSDESEDWSEIWHVVSHGAFEEGEDDYHWIVDSRGVHSHD